MTAPDSLTSVTEECSETPPEELAPRSGRWISANMSGRLSQFAASLFAPLIFFLVAICLRLHWSHSGLYPIAGDEPGYLVASRSLWVHHSVEMTAAYHDAVRHHTFFIGAAKLARTHHGLYSVHGLGLPFLVGPGVILNGSAGARSVMLLIAVAAPILVYATVRLEGVSAARSGVLALALTLSASLLANSAEIYPDLPAGVIAAGVLVLVLRRARLQRVERPSIRYGALGLIALLPWLHTRFLVPCVILAFATILLRRHPSRRSVAIEAGIVALSFVALSGYNLTYFGRLSGGLSVHNEVASAHNILLVFIGLNVDRFQGLFPAQPILLFAVLGIVILLRRYRDVGLLALTLYLAFLASNALRAEYGGLAIAGRFTMSAAIVLLIPAAVGLVEVARRSATAVLGIAIGVIALDAWQLSRIWNGSLGLRNDLPRLPRSIYPSWLPLLGRSLPAVYGVSWGGTFLPNYVFPAALLTFAAGCGLAVYKHPRTGASLAVLGLVAFVTPTASATPTKSQERVTIAADVLSPTTGRSTSSGDVDAEPGRDAPGLLAVWPAFPMSDRANWIGTIHYSSPASPRVSVAVARVNLGRRAFGCAVRMPGTNGRERAFSVKWRSAGTQEPLRFRVVYLGSARVQIAALGISHGAPTHIAEQHCIQ
jgi:hypothetical protein